MKVAMAGQADCIAPGAHPIEGETLDGAGI